MNVFKFGGASVKNAEGIRNLQSIVSQSQSESLFIVVSAMGKTTNALENVVRAYIEKGDWKTPLTEIVDATLVFTRDKEKSKRDSF